MYIYVYWKIGQCNFMAREMKIRRNMKNNERQMMKENYWQKGRQKKPNICVRSKN
jgi:hypothetical protein